MGCASLGSRVGRRQSREVLQTALDSGINFFDTAPLYGEGDSESILGHVLEGRRDKVVISTKVGWLPSGLLTLASKSKQVIRLFIKALPRVPATALQKHAQSFIRSNNVVDFRPASMVGSVEASLRRLHTDYIDILLL